MSRTKKLPDDVKQNCICLVKGYTRRKAEYKNRRDSLMSVSADNVITIKDPDNPEDESKHVGVLLPGAHHASRTTEDIAERILGLEKLPETKRMRAVEHAMERVGLDLREEQRTALRNAIFISCTQGRRYPFERLMISGMERSCFYERRMKFLVDIAKFMDMV